MMSKGYYVTSGDYVGSTKSWITREACEVKDMLAAFDKAFQYLTKYESVEIRKRK
jgi:hypothetical protein